MKRLLIFHPALAPYRVDFFNRLAESFDTDLVLFDRNLVNQKFDQASLVGQMRCRVSYLEKGFRYKDRYFRCGAIRKLWSVRPNIVLLSEYGLIPIAIVLYKVLTHARFKVYTISDDNVQMLESRKGLKGAILSLFLRHVDGIIVTNSNVAKALRARTARQNIAFPVVPILHARIPQDRASKIVASGAAWRKEHLAAYKRVLLFVGRLDPEKNVEWLVDCMSELDAETCLVIVGSGTLDEQIRKSQSVHKQTNVFLLGRKEGDEVYAFMSMADILVLPSTYEPYGAVVGEALQVGTPCLVSTSVGAKELVSDGRCGAIFAVNDKVDFITKLNQIVIPKTKTSLVASRFDAAMNDLIAEIDYV